MAAIIAHWVFQPLHGNGYQLWSGILGSFLTSLPGWTVASIIFWRHHNCQEHRCLKLGHAHPDHGMPVCRAHYHNDLTPRPNAGN